MDRLRSPGGCPWDAEQTHESLLKYLLEEAYEFIEAVESGDRDAMREELGDVLLQVIFHARMAEEASEGSFNVEDVAKGVTDKLISRHPHVFSSVEVSGTDEVVQNWEKIKAAEKSRTSALDGVPVGQPALPLAAKVLHRVEKYEYEIPTDQSISIPTDLSQKKAGEILLSVIEQIQAQGIDPEAALRTATKAYIEAVQAHESR
jgi:XTP/dITP diphosphohydrolase